MRFGLWNAPRNFWRLVNKAFAKEINSFILVYLYAILIFCRSIGEHWDHLQTALDRLRRDKVYGQLHKCEFFKDKIDYFGFEVSKDGIHLPSEKVKAVLHRPCRNPSMTLDHFLD